MKKIFATILLFGWTTAHAQIMTEIEATPSVLSEQHAFLLISEVSFKNSTADWLKLHYHSAENKPTNLKGLRFADDSTFKTIDEDFIIASGQDVLLTFKSEQADEMPYLYSSRSGLTGTTEQIILYDQDDTVLDALCWTSDSPTEAEIQDQADLFELEGWNSPDITSCLSSETVKKEETVIRDGLNDSNSAIDWILPQPEPEPEPISMPSQSENKTPELEEIETPSTPIEEPNIQTLTKKNTTVTHPLLSPEIIAVNMPEPAEQETKGSSSSKTSKAVYRNGQTSGDIIISEILPNPDGTDTKKEWVEISNFGETVINLGNWTLDDAEDGSKPYTIPDTLTLQPGRAQIISTENSKLSLGNKEDSIRLFNFQQELVDQVDYEEAPSGQSYSNIIIQQEDGTLEQEWIWTEEMTPNSLNPYYQQFHGIVIAEPTFDILYSFDIKNQNEEIRTIRFDESNIAGPLAKATFTEGTSLLLTIEPNEQKLIRFEVLAKAPGKSHFPPFMVPTIIGTIIIIAAASFYLVHKKIPWQETAKPL